MASMSVTDASALAASVAVDTPVVPIVAPVEANGHEKAELDEADEDDEGDAEEEGGEVTSGKGSAYSSIVAAVFINDR